MDISLGTRKSDLINRNPSCTTCLSSPRLWTQPPPATFIYHPPRVSFFPPSFHHCKLWLPFSIFIPPPLCWAKQIKCAIKCIFTLCCCANDIMFCAWGWSRVSRLESTRKIHRGWNAQQQLHAPFHGILKAHLRIVAAKLDATWDPGRFGHLNIFSPSLVDNFHPQVPAMETLACTTRNLC